MRYALESCQYCLGTGLIYKAMPTYETSPALRSITRAFVAIEKTTSFPPAVGLAMWACESGWGAKITGDNNYFGITRPPESGPAKMCPTHEDITLAQLALFRADEQATVTSKAPLSNGLYRVYMSRWFASYPSLTDACEEYVQLFTASPKRYRSAWGEYLQDHDADALLRHICEAGYATGPAEQVELTIAHQGNIVAAIAKARAEMAAA